MADSPLKLIVCPVDFSQTSDHALHYAAQLARRAGAQLELVHVLESVDYLLTDGAWSVPKDLWQSAETQAQERLEQQATAVGGEALVRGVRVVTGTAHSAICEAAEAAGADLIVLGTHGRSGVRHMLLGSVAEKVVRTSTCPVLTVRKP